MQVSEVLDFWFADDMEKHWFASTPELDQQIKQRFEATWQAAAEGQLDTWAKTVEGCLALIIVLDQLPLNMFRGNKQSFQTEAQAIAVTRKAIDKGWHQQLSGAHLAFLLMPLMHSEKLSDQDDSVRYYREANLQHNLSFAEHHRELIRRFGRFPHRNAILGRESTLEEIAYLQSDEAFTG